MNITTFIKTLDTKSLLALYNELTNKSTKKFASRDKGEDQVIGVVKVSGPDAVEAACKKLKIALPEATDEVDNKPPKPRARRGTNLAPLPGAPVACREGTKQAILLDCLSQPGGVCMSELINRLSGGKKPWTEATVRSGFGWDMKQKGYGVRSEFGEDGVEYFFIVLPVDKNGIEFAIPPHRTLKGVPKADARQTRLDANFFKKLW